MPTQPPQARYATSAPILGKKPPIAEVRLEHESIPTNRAAIVPSGQAIAALEQNQWGDLTEQYARTIKVCRIASCIASGRQATNLVRAQYPEAASAFVSAAEAIGRFEHALLDMKRAIMFANNKERRDSRGSKVASNLAMPSHNREHLKLLVTKLAASAESNNAQPLDPAVSAQRARLEKRGVKGQLDQLITLHIQMRESLVELNKHHHTIPAHLLQDAANGHMAALRQESERITCPHRLEALCERYLTGCPPPEEREATDAMLKLHEGLVHEMVSAIAPTRSWDEREELLQIGRQALWDAIKEFDVDLGYRFSTSACRCIHMRIRSTLRSFPRRRIASLDAPIGNSDDKISRGAMVLDRSTLAPPERMMLQEARSILRGIRNLVDELPPRFREIIVSRWGLDGHPKETFEVIGKRLGVTKEATRQAHKRALKLLAERFDPELLEDMFEVLGLDNRLPSQSELRRQALAPPKQTLNHDSTPRRPREGRLQRYKFTTRRVATSGSSIPSSSPSESAPSPQEPGSLPAAVAKLPHNLQRFAYEATSLNAEKKPLSPKRATEALGISKATYYRLKQQLRAALEPMFGKAHFDELFRANQENGCRWRSSPQE